MHEQVGKLLPTLRAFDASLIAVGHDIIDSVTHKESDDFGWMAIPFLCKQLGHMDAIFTLGLHRDVVLIVRSMQEGLWQLIWAANAIPERPQQWRAFRTVAKWRQMHRDIARGRAVDPELRARIEADVQREGVAFIRPAKAQEARPRRVGDVEDPYWQTWRKHVSLASIANEVGAQLIHQLFYTDFSDWHHWDAAGIERVLNRSGNRISFEGQAAQDVAQALVSGFGCLHQTCELVDSHLQLGYASRLQGLQIEILEWHRSKGILGESS